MLEQITLGQILTWIGGAGAAGTPLVIMTIMWWRAEQRADRLQTVVESFLPTATSMVKVSRAVTRAATGSEDEDGE